MSLHQNDYIVHCICKAKEITTINPFKNIYIYFICIKINKENKGKNFNNFKTLFRMELNFSMFVCCMYWFCWPGKVQYMQQSDTAEVSSVGNRER